MLPHPARKADLEQLLARRGFAATLPGAGSAAGLVEKDEPLPPASITEIVATAGSAGATSLGLHLAARTGGKLAWVDPAGRLDPASAAAAGIDLQHLLWLGNGDVNAALQAALWITQAGGFRLIVLDLLEGPAAELHIPRAAWFRLRRGLERERRTALLLLGRHALAGACADRVIEIGASRIQWENQGPGLLLGLDLETRDRSARRGVARHPPGSVPAASRWELRA